MSSSSGVFRFVFGATVFRLAIFCALIVAAFCCHGSVPPRRRSPTVTPTTDAPGGNTTDKPAGPEGATFSFKAQPPFAWTFFGANTDDQKTTEDEATTQITGDIKKAVDEAAKADFKQSITVVLDPVHIPEGSILGGTTCSAAGLIKDAQNTIIKTCDAQGATPMEVSMTIKGKLQTTEVVEDSVWTGFGEKLKTQLLTGLTALKIVDDKVDVTKV